MQSPLSQSKLHDEFALHATLQPPPSHWKSQLAPLAHAVSQWPPSHCAFVLAPVATSILQLPPSHWMLQLAPLEHSNAQPPPSQSQLQLSPLGQIRKLSPGAGVDSIGGAPTATTAPPGPTAGGVFVIDV